MYLLLSSGMKLGGFGRIGLYLAFGVEVEVEARVVLFAGVCGDEAVDNDRLLS